MNKLVILSLLFLIGVGITVSRVKYEVVFLKSQLRDVNSKISKLSDDISVYNAEWSYLNDPQRLRRLCEKYLKDLRPTENEQMLDYEAIIGNELEMTISPGALGSLLDRELDISEDGSSDAEEEL